MSPDNTTWRPAYIGIGSNLDEPVRQVEAAIAALDEIAETCVVGRSHLYRSAPFGGMDQPDYVNAVAAVLTLRSAEELLAALQNIEMRAGRVRGERWAPRVLDLDLLVFSTETVDTPELTVPHPRIAERNFVLLPLRELAPDLAIPGLGRVAKLPVDVETPRITRID